MNDEDYISIKNLRDIGNLEKLDYKLKKLNGRTLNKNYKTSLDSKLKDLEYLNNISKTVTDIITQDNEYIYDKLITKKNMYEDKYKNISDIKKNLDIEYINDYYKTLDGKNSKLNIKNIFEINDYEDSKVQDTMHNFITQNFSNMMRNLRKIRNRNNSKNKELKEFLFGNDTTDLYSIREYKKNNANSETFQTIEHYSMGFIDYRYISFQHPLIFNNENIASLCELIKTNNSIDFEINGRTNVKKLFTDRKYGLYYLYNEFDLDNFDDKLFANKFIKDNKQTNNTILSVLDDIIKHNNDNSNEFKNHFNNLFDVLLSINYYLYDIVSDHHKKILDNIDSSITRLKEYYDNCIKNSYNPKNSNKIDVPLLLKSFYNFNEKNYKNKDNKTIYIGVMPTNKQLGVVMYNIFYEYLSNVYDLYLNNYKFLDKIIKKSGEAVYHSKIAKMRNEIKKEYDGIIGVTNNKSQEIEIIALFTIFKERYKDYLDEYKENLIESLNIRNELLSNRSIYNDSYQFKTLTNNYNRYLSNALYFRYISIFYKKLVVLMFLEYKSKYSGSKAFTDVKLNELKRIMNKVEENIRKINKNSLKYNITKNLENYLSEPSKLDVKNMDIQKLINKGEVTQKAKNSVRNVKSNKKPNKVSNSATKSKINKANEYNKINEELKEREYDKINEEVNNVKVNSKLKNKLKTISNINKDELPKDIQKKVVKIKLWKVLREKGYNGNTMFIPFINKKLKSNQYGLFNIYQALLDGSVKKSHLIIGRNINDDVLKDEVKAKGVINVGLDVDKYNEWRVMDFEAIKDLQKSKDNELRLKIYELLSNKSNYVDATPHMFSNSSVLKKMIINYCGNKKLSKCDILTSQTTLMKNLNKILK